MALRRARLGAALAAVRRARAGAALAAAAALLGGCTGAQDALDPAGIQAERIADLWWVYLAVAIVVFVVFIGLLLWAVARRRDASEEPPLPESDPPYEREVRHTRVVTAATIVTALVLLGLLLGDLVTRRGLESLVHRERLAVQVTGHQWWWEFTYQDPVPANMVTTANELHLPVGRPVRLDLRADDVIHSFWVPNLQGKKDLIPGHPTSTWLRADRPGTYYGQCAEYCGMQHATMRFVVVAEPESAFTRWLDAQRQPGRAPVTDREKRGQQVFLAGTCVMCHTIQGTEAGSRMGPDLTHVASRPWIGAASLPNTRGNLAGWIADPQRIRPGVHMPPNPIAPTELQALLDYLESLK